MTALVLACSESLTWPDVAALLGTVGIFCAFMLLLLWVGLR
jgi:hypothetical protein